MARSKKNGSGYWSDEYKKSGRGSVNKIKRKKVRDVTATVNSSGIAAVDNMPTRTFTQRYSLATMDHDEVGESRNDKIALYQRKEAELLEEKDELKQEKRSERFKVLCEKRSEKTVKKLQKRLERDGLETPYDEESTDSETEEEYQKSRSQAIHGDLAMAKKFLDTGSGAAFKQERYYFRK